MRREEKGFFMSRLGMGDCSRMFVLILCLGFCSCAAKPRYFSFQPLPEVAERSGGSFNPDLQEVRDISKTRYTLDIKDFNFSMQTEDGKPLPVVQGSEEKLKERFIEFLAARNITPATGGEARYTLKGGFVVKEVMHVDWWAYPLGVVEIATIPLGPIVLSAIPQLDYSHEGITTVNLLDSKGGKVILQKQLEYKSKAITLSGGDVGWASSARRNQYLAQNIDEAFDEVVDQVSAAIKGNENSKLAPK